MRRGAVIAGSGWVYYSAVDAEAAQRIASRPGAKHIDEEPIAELKAIRQERGAADTRAACRKLRPHRNGHWAPHSEPH